MDGPGAAYADDGLDALEMVQFIRIKADGRHAHSVSHHAHALAFVSAGVAQHAADFIEADRILEVSFGHEFDAERVSGHDDGFGYVAIFGSDMRSGGIFLAHECYFCGCVTNISNFAQKYLTLFLRLENDMQKKHSFPVRLRAFLIWQELGYLPWRKPQEEIHLKKSMESEFMVCLVQTSLRNINMY